VLDLSNFPGSRFEAPKVPMGVEYGGVSLSPLREGPQKFF